MLAHVVPGRSPHRDVPLRLLLPSTAATSASACSRKTRCPVDHRCCRHFFHFCRTASSREAESGDRTMIGYCCWPLCGTSCWRTCWRTSDGRARGGWGGRRRLWRCRLRFWTRFRCRSWSLGGREVKIEKNVIFGFIGIWRFSPRGLLERGSMYRITAKDLRVKSLRLKASTRVMRIMLTTETLARYISQSEYLVALCTLTIHPTRTAQRG